MINRERENKEQEGGGGGGGGVRGKEGGEMEGRRWWKVNYFIVVFPSVCKSSRESAKHTYCE